MTSQRHGTKIAAKTGPTSTPPTAERIWSYTLGAERRPPPPDGTRPRRQGPPGAGTTRTSAGDRHLWRPRPVGPRSDPPLPRRRVTPFRCKVPGGATKCP